MATIPAHQPEPRYRSVRADQEVGQHAPLQHPLGRGAEPPVGPDHVKQDVGVNQPLLALGSVPR